MTTFASTRLRAWTPVGAVLLGLAAAAPATANVWQSTFGQPWFYESRSGAGQPLAGTWWESSLAPGNTYRIRFEVNQLKGRAALLLGEQRMPIEREGWHSYEFRIRQGGKRRLMFVTRRNNTTLGVRKISVLPASGATAQHGGGGGGHGLPKGHYLSFDRQRNLKAEMLDVIYRGRKARSGWHLGIARELNRALSLPAVKGFSMRVHWGTLEKGDGRYDWGLLDANMAVARRLGLKFIVQVAYRSFDGSRVSPRYFPGRYKLRTNGGGNHGFVAKLWEPYVYRRLIRLHRQIAARYGNDPAFGGIASSETAIGKVSGGGYSYWKYRSALARIARESQSALPRGRYFWYLNFLPGGDSFDMRRDGRVSLVNSVPHHALVVGGPDITPDRRGMTGSFSSFRIHLRKTRPQVQQFCHAQNADQGLGGINRKTNVHRKAFIAKVQRVRKRERQHWFKGQPAIFHFDDLRAPNGRKVDLHPNSELGKLWHPRELFHYANRNFRCDYFFWNYRENVHNVSSQFWWEDVRPVIMGNPHFHR